MMGLLLAVFLAFMAIILDGGYLYFEKRRMQLAADAGSWDGAWELLRGNSSRMVSAGRYSARLNGFTHGEDGADVQITLLNTTDVEAVVQKPVPTFFANVFNVSSANVAARAVSSIQYPGELCILALNPTADKAVNVTGTGVINVNCGVQSNSCYGYPGGSGGGNGAFCVAGTGSDPAGFYTEWAGTCGTTATPGHPTVVPVVEGYDDSDPENNPGVPPTPNPFAGRNEPDGPGTLDHPPGTPQFIDYPTIDGSLPDPDGTDDGTTYLDPGYYGTTDSTPSIEIGASAVVIFNPGLYYIEGLKITGGCVEGIGITLYNMGAGGETIDITGNSDCPDPDPGVNFEAMTMHADPTTAQTENMVVWCSSDSPTGPRHNFAGNAETRIVGIVYCETQEVRWGGTHGADGWGIIVSDTVVLNGTADMVFEPPPGGGIVIPELQTVTLIK